MVGSDPKANEVGPFLVEISTQLHKVLFRIYFCSTPVPHTWRCHIWPVNTCETVPSAEEFSKLQLLLLHYEYNLPFLVFLWQLQGTIQQLLLCFQRSSFNNGWWLACNAPHHMPWGSNSWMRLPLVLTSFIHTNRRDCAGS